MPWQPNLGQKIALISSLQEIEKFIVCTVGISGLVNFNTLSEFLREPRELPWQPNSEKYKPQLQKISVSCQKSRNFSHVQQGFMGFVNSNVLPEFSKELRELPWQPNLGKNKPKLHKFQFLTRNLEIFGM